MIRPLEAGLLVLGLAGCGSEAEPRPQWVVVVSTDAPVPRFGDRLLLEVTRDSGEPACSACRRVIDASNAGEWPHSFGIADPQTGSDLVLRARLFRAGYLGADGLPAGPTLIDASGRLPAGDGRVYLPMTMDCFGASDDDPSTTCIGDFALGPLPTLSTEPAVLEPGSWPPAAPVSCDFDVPGDMVCVPGGVYLIGAHGEPAVASTPGSEPSPERLVRVDPFALDLDEVTVAAVRPAVDAGKIVLPSAPPPKNPLEGCTFGPAGDTDVLPMNCIDHDAAQVACGELGKVLPTEAQWEYAASGAAGETSYPWGDSTSICEHAVIAVGDVSVGDDNSCRAKDRLVPSGVRVGGSATDLTPLGVRNLGGNLQEWVADGFEAYGGSCWPGGLVENPACAVGSDARAVIRGGGWKTQRTYARSAARIVADVGAWGPGLGFRCAKSR